MGKLGSAAAKPAASIHRLRAAQIIGRCMASDDTRSPGRMVACLSLASMLKCRRRCPISHPGADTLSRGNDVVIADLDPSFREQIRERLAPLRVHCTPVADRAELDRLVDAPDTGPVILITDIRMAGGDVRAFVERLR